MNFWEAKYTTEFLGRAKARIFYAICGLCAMIFGVLMMLGIAKP